MRLAFSLGLGFVPSFCSTEDVFSLDLGQLHSDEPLAWASSRGENSPFVVVLDFSALVSSPIHEISVDVSCEWSWLVRTFWKRFWASSDQNDMLW